MSLRPINPPLPLFYAPCVKCGYKGNSLSMAAADAPFTYVCFGCQDDATRESIRLSTNEVVKKFTKTNPALVAYARASLGFERPPNADADDPSWSGCARSQR